MLVDRKMKMLTHRLTSLMLITGLLLGLSGWGLARWLPLKAQECGCPTEINDEKQCNSWKISCLQDKIKEKQSQATTLGNIITVLSSQISVQELQIRQTRLEIARLIDEVEQLTTRISGLNVSLDRMSLAMIERVNTSYRRREANPFYLLLDSESLQHFVARYRYLQLTQAHTTEIMKQAETQKLDYDQQKALKEQKQKEIEQKKAELQNQQNQLTRQRTEQQALLDQTKNDEKRYQEELARTLAESGAIRSIVAGRGQEIKIGDVKQGDKIATVIQGASPCSNGTHLHFEVVKNGGHENPAGYLRTISPTWNNQPDDPFNFNGDWDWPLNNAARINQGYGMTFFARVRRAYGGAPHTGIDIMSKDGDLTVKAVKDGTLYAGAIACGGRNLNYVKVEHKDSDLTTYYLHVRS